MAGCQTRVRHAITSRRAPTKPEPGASVIGAMRICQMRPVRNPDHDAKLALSDRVTLLRGGDGDEHLGGEVMAWENKAEFEQHFRDLRRPDVGDEADEYTELDMVTELTEDGWPDACGWMQIFMRIHDGGELTPREREQALAYWNAGEELPADDMRLPPCGPACQRDNRE